MCTELRPYLSGIDIALEENRHVHVTERPNVVGRLRPEEIREDADILPPADPANVFHYRRSSPHRV